MNEDDTQAALYHQQQLEQQEQEETCLQFTTNHPIYNDFQITMQRLDDECVLLNIGQSACKAWVVLTREDAQKFSHYLSLVTR